MDTQKIELFKKSFETIKHRRYLNNKYYKNATWGSQSSKFFLNDSNLLYSLFISYLRV